MAQIIEKFALLDVSTKMSMLASIHTDIFTKGYNEKNLDIWKDDSRIGFIPYVPNIPSSTYGGLQKWKKSSL